MGRTYVAIDGNTYDESTGQIVSYGTGSTSSTTPTINTSSIVSAILNGQVDPNNIDSYVQNAVLQQYLSAAPSGTGTGYNNYNANGPALIQQIKSQLNGQTINYGGQVYNFQNGQPIKTTSTVNKTVVTGNGTTTSTSGTSAKASNSSVTIPATALQPGSTNTAAVKQLQDFLVSQGVMTQAQVNTGYGTYGPQTTAAVKTWQQNNGVDNSSGPGYWGPRSIAVANSLNTSSPSSSSSSSSNSSTNTTGSIGSYKGVPIMPGTSAEISAQMAKIDSGQTGSTGSTASTGSGFGEDYNKSGDTPSSFYGATSRNSNAEQQSLELEQGASSAFAGAGIISSSFLSTISSDPSIMAYYVNALTYGGYTMGDILNDMKRREMISQGNTSAKDLQIINPEVNKQQYISTPEGQKSVSSTASMIPTFNFQGLLNPDILKYGSNIPDDLFKTLVPILDPNSQEFKDAVAKVKATYFDIASAKLQATTEQEKAIADYNEQQFKEQIEKQYGIALSDDATKAWNQINSIEDTFNKNGIAGSGLQNEAIDKSLQATRKADQLLRDEKLTKEEADKGAYYRTSATAAQIASLTPEERTQWGLTPSADILQQFSVSNLLAKNPAWTQEMAQQAHDAVIDENGNYRSAIYAKYYDSIATGGQTNQTNAVNAVTLDAQNKEADAYKNYDASTAPLGQIVKQDSTSNSLTPDQASSSSNAAGDISSSISNPGSQPNTPNTSNTSSTDRVNGISQNPNVPNADGTPYSPTNNSQNTSTPTSIPTSTSTKTGYQGPSVVDYLTSVGKDSSYNNRATLAKQSGISNYTGTAAQNTQLLTSLRGS